MDNPLISIIIPVYNAEKYLHQCLDSVVAQTYTNWECLLIDDGSKDSSGVICDEYAAKDSRFRVFHKENGGVSSARNLGIKNIKGDWVIFYDSDDYIPENAIISFVPYLADSKIDSLAGNYINVRSDLSKFESNTVSKSTLYSVSDALKLFFIYPLNGFQGYLWNRIFRRAIIDENNLLFNENISYKEDGLFLVQFIVASGLNIVFIPDIVYFYYDRADGAMGKLNNTFTPKYLTNLDARLLIKCELEKNSLSSNIIELAEESVVDIVKRVLVRIYRSKQFKYLFYVLKRLVEYGMFFNIIKIITLQKIFKKRL